MGRNKGLGPVSLIILSVVGAFFLYFGIKTIAECAGLMIEAKKYVPQEFSIIDEEDILQQKDEIRAAYKEYSEKAGISFKLVVCYYIKEEDYSGYSDKRGERYAKHCTDAFEFLDAYSEDMSKYEAMKKLYWSE